MRKEISNALFRDGKVPSEMVIARLCLALHKTPDEIRSMTLVDMDLITYVMYCDEKRSSEQARISAEMRNVK